MKSKKVNNIFSETEDALEIRTDSIQYEDLTQKTKFDYDCSVLNKFKHSDSEFISLLSRMEYTPEQRITNENKDGTFVVIWDFYEICKTENIEMIQTIKNEFPNAKYFIATSYGYERNYFVTNDEDELKYNINSLLQKDISIWDNLCKIVSTICHSIYGREYNAMSRDAAYSICQKCLSHINMGMGNFEMDNPVKTFCDKLDKDELSEKSDAEIEALLMDCKNANILFGERETNTPYTVLYNMLSQTIISDSSINAISNVIANSAKNNTYISKKSAKSTQKETMFKSYTPKMIYDLISESVVHQEAAKKAAAMLVYNHIRNRGRNIVMAGPTGCGKTEIWRTLSTVFPFIRIVNGPQLSMEGWKGGTKISNIFTAEPPALANHLIVVIDEADKVFEPRIAAGGSDYSIGLQNELLKIMDHTKNNIITFTSEDKKSITVDCKGVSIVLCGSFERMFNMKTSQPAKIGFSESEPKVNTFDENSCTEEDLVNYANMRIELTGRINQIVLLRKMTANDFETILNHPTASPIKQMEKEMDVKINMSKPAKRRLAEIAFETKLGCRAIKSKLIQYVDAQAFEDPARKKYNLTKQILESSNEKEGECV